MPRTRAPDIWLYRFVYHSKTALGLVIFLYLCFFVQLAERAAAASPLEVTSDTESAITDALLERLEAADPASLPEPPGVVVDEEVTEQPPVTVISEEPPLVSIAQEEELIATTTEIDNASTTITELPNLSDLAAVSATTTDESVVFVTTESDAVIQFEKADCVSVADGSYYCTNEPEIPVERDGLFALPDKDGDLEIYLQRSGELAQLTFNSVDDSSPYYDPASDSIVWHRFIDDRYQVVTYDVASSEESQLTDTATNNMEPFRADNIIVWQHWKNNAWQIMLYDGEDIVLLTDTSEHNLAPVVRNNFVMWHRVQGGEKTIEVYDMQSDSYLTIADDSGGTVANPRMVLVYDTVLPSGEIMTRGYDIVTGETNTFTPPAAPPLPEDIPDPERTGEPRALSIGKNLEEELSELPYDVPPPSDDYSPEQKISTTTAPTSDLTLDLRSGLVSTSTVTVPTMVPDVIITPFTETIATSTDFSSPNQ